MPTKIEYQTWTGGDGSGDPAILIGYCKEEPEEVLASTLFTHYIYRYKSIYRPVSTNYPNNVMGLVISDTKDLTNVGLEITGTLDKLVLERAKRSTDEIREIDTFLEAHEVAKRWYLDVIFPVTMLKAASEIEEIRRTVGKELRKIYQEQVLPTPFKLIEPSTEDPVEEEEEVPTPEIILCNNCATLPVPRGIKNCPICLTNIMRADLLTCSDCAKEGHCRRCGERIK